MEILLNSEIMWGITGYRVYVGVLLVQESMWKHNWLQRICWDIISYREYVGTIVATEYM